MGRRTFIRRLIKGLAAWPLMNLLSVPMGTAEEQNLEKDLFYRPLNGAVLREIAGRKLHHGHNHFINPMGLHQNGRFIELMRWKFFSLNAFSRYLADQPVLPISIHGEVLLNRTQLSITFLKHAGLLIKDQDRTFFVDPIMDNIFWFIKDYNPSTFGVANLPRPDHILITHGHFDHLDLPTLNAFFKDTHVISPLGYGNEFESLAMHRRTQLDWFDTYADQGRDVVLLPCNHWTMRSPLEGPNTSLWGSYLIRTRGGYTIYVSGDTAYFDGFEQIGATYDIDLAIINLGAYEPRWFMGQSHINPQETVRAFKELKAKKLMIVHWGAFQLGDEPVHFPPLHIREEMTKAGLVDRLVDLRGGETYFPI